MGGKFLNVGFKLGVICILMTLLFIPTNAFSMKVEKSKLYFVGVGPAGPDLATLQAIDVIKQADVVFSPYFIQKAFKEYLEGKDVRVAWPDSVYQVGNKSYVAVSNQDDLKILGKGIREHADSLASQFKKLMSEGKSVALLVNGDPCLFSDLRWFKNHFKKEEFEVIPGMSSLNVGTALFKADLTSSQAKDTVIIYSPISEPFENKRPISKLAKHQASMVFFMAGDLKKVVEELKEEYNGGTPIAVAYFVGYPDKQKVIKGTLNTILIDTEAEKEREMVLIYVGSFLK